MYGDPLENLTPQAPPFKVSGTAKDQSATENLLLVIISIHCRISCTVPEVNRDFGRKSHVFSIPCI